MKRFLILGMLILSACQTTGATPFRDGLGNTYPEKCRGPITQEGYYHVLSGVKGYVQRQDNDKMPPIRGTKIPSKETAAGRDGGSIWIARDTSPYQFEDVLRHELCHLVAGAWHPYEMEQ